MVSDQERVNEHFAALLRARTQCAWVSPTYVLLPPSADLTRLEGHEDIVVAVRDTYLPQEPAWLDELAGVLALPGAAAVAPLLILNTHNQILNAGWVKQEGGLEPLYPDCEADGGGLAGPADLVRDVDGLSPEILVFPRATDHRELFTGIARWEGWPDRLVMWGHVKFRLINLPHRSGTLNGNLALSGPTVRFAR